MDQRGSTTITFLGGTMAAISPLPLHLLLFAAADVTDPSGGWVTILQQFGPFLPFAVLCLVIMRMQWKKTEALERQLASAQELTISKIVPALTDTNTLLSKNTEELTRATEVLREVNRRPEMDPDTWRRVLNALERSENGDHR